MNDSKKSKPHSHGWKLEGEECGPQKWSHTNLSTQGKHQSPINIETRKAVYDEELLKNPLTIKYEINCCNQIRNTGYTFQVDGFPDNESRVRGGPVKNEYSFLQFHMHWGDSTEAGSEHLLNGKPYAAEMHFVNWNHELFKTPAHASQCTKNTGLLVLAVFIKVGDENEEFTKLSKCMHEIHLKNQCIPVDHVNIKNLLPKNLKNYWTYPGSLTTPPCTECVQWVIFKEPIELSKSQLEKCHELYQVSKEKLCNEFTVIKYNDRPICQMNNRMLLKSFKD